MEIKLTNLTTNKIETFTAQDGVIKIPPGNYSVSETLILPTTQIRKGSKIELNTIAGRSAVSIDKASVKDVVYRNNTISNVRKRPLD